MHEHAWPCMSMHEHAWPRMTMHDLYPWHEVRTIFSLRGQRFPGVPTCWQTKLRIPRSSSFAHNLAWFDVQCWQAWNPSPNKHTHKSWVIHTAIAPFHPKPSQKNVRPFLVQVHVLHMKKHDMRHVSQKQWHVLCHQGALMWCVCHRPNALFTPRSQVSTYKRCDDLVCPMSSS